jgi:predicted flap endonuclease-1-like 5' DNA nuclease
VELWQWIVLIVVVLVVLFAIWWWWTRMRSTPAAPMAPRMEPRMAVAPPTERREALPAPEVPEVNDLAEIEGIGPRIHDILNEAGIKTFAQLADTPVERIREILVAAEFKAPANPATWPAQARLAADSKWQELKELQASLKGGR